jgi:hypothetical protein
MQSSSLHRGPSCDARDGTVIQLQIERCDLPSILAFPGPHNTLKLCPKGGFRRVLVNPCGSGSFLSDMQLSRQLADDELMLRRVFGD